MANICDGSWHNRGYLDARLGPTRVSTALHSRRLLLTLAYPLYLVY